MNCRRYDPIPICRRAAEDLFSLETGTVAYRKLYDEILEHQDGPETANAR